MTDDTKSQQPATRRRAVTRRRLLQAALEVFIEHGIRDTPVELICDRAGFTRGAFYSNFDSKEDLFLAILEEQVQLRLEQLEQSVNEALATFGPERPDSVLNAVVRASMPFTDQLAVDENWYLLNAEFRAQALRQPELRAQTERVQQRLLDDLANVLTNMLDRIGMRLLVQPRDAALVVISLYDAAIERGLFEGGSGPADRLVTEILPLMTSALMEPVPN
ncbi:TetR/AcrR family transcriptional regulator [Haloechinothrix salitolerans]|uniref:TetR/AcrR family transcriptional regulator n=1 Tax=Haloechinothrix salitolerans TaxID=926830 RepID=A0ABW2C4R6_9PSEU